MSNQSYLTAAPREPDDFNDVYELQSHIYEGTYRIPALWFTLFDQSCVKTFHDAEDEMDVPFLVTSHRDAIQRAEKLVPQFMRAFSDANELCSHWLEDLASLDTAYLVADVSEIIFMDESGVSELP